MKTLPLLSVIMPVYNAEKFLSDAMKSVLGQSFKNLELIIINDGSTDKSELVVQSFTDERIRYFKNEENSGIVYSRNRGLKLAKGDFIGMVDADDIVYPEKFEKQIEFLKQNPEYGFVGSWARFIDENGKRIPGGWKLKASPEKIPAIMFFKNYFLQSAVVYQKDCIKNFSFTKGFEIGEDYLIWYQMLKKYKAWNFPEYLVDYRMHQHNITVKQKEKGYELEREIFRIQFKELGIEATDEELDIHMKIRYTETINSTELLKEIEKWLMKILRYNDLNKVYDKKHLYEVVTNRWMKVCSKFRPVSLSATRVCLTSKLFSTFILNRDPLKGRE